MPRFDKVEPKGGSFRAVLAFAIAAPDVGVVVAVGLDANGKVVKGAGQTGVVGVICPSQPMAIGRPIDVMTDGEIVDMVAPFVAGTAYYAVSASGVVEAVAPAAGILKARVGHTVEAWRLVVRVSPYQG